VLAQSRVPVIPLGRALPASFLCVRVLRAELLGPLPAPGLPGPSTAGPVHPHAHFIGPSQIGSTGWPTSSMGPPSFAQTSYPARGPSPLSPMDRTLDRTKAHCDPLILIFGDWTISTAVDRPAAWSDPR